MRGLPGSDYLEVRSVVGRVQVEDASLAQFHQEEVVLAEKGNAYGGLTASGARKGESVAGGDLIVEGIHVAHDRETDLAEVRHTRGLGTGDPSPKGVAAAALKSKEKGVADEGGAEDGPRPAITFGHRREPPWG